MKTITQQHKKVMQNLWIIHLKVSSFVAKLIGPIVFNYGTNDKDWHLTTAELLQYPEESIGKVLGKFLQEQNLEPLAKAEYHDLQHVLLDYSVTFKGEVELQFFLHGNGNRSIASYSTIIGAWFILPFHWKILKASYKRGKCSTDISQISLQTLHQNIYKIKKALLIDVIN